MASITDLTDLLVQALNQPHDRLRLVRRFQDAVADEPETPAGDPGWDVLTTLATDLEFYVPDPEQRREHRNYYGDEQLRREILGAIRALVESGLLPSDVLARAAARPA